MTSNAAIKTPSRVLIYRVDRDDVIVFVNEAFRVFAVENEASALSECIGTRLWSFIQDWDTRELYRLTFERVRASGIATTIPFRCDSPDRRRFMSMAIRRIAGDLIEVRCELKREELRPSVRLDQIQSQQPNELITMCSWCKRIRGPSLDWLDVEIAIAEMRVFEADAPRLITHGICPRCFQNLSAAAS